MAEPIDRVVAVVGDQLVLASDVRLLELLAVHDPSPLPIWQASAKRAVDVAAVRELASDVSVYAPRPEQVAARLDAVRDSFETDDAFQEFLAARGMSEEDLYALLRRRLTVEQFVRRNIDLDPTSPAFGEALESLFAQVRERVVIRNIQVQPR